MNGWGVFKYKIKIDNVFSFIITNTSPNYPLFLKAGTVISISEVNDDGGHLQFAGYQNN